MDVATFNSWTIKPCFVQNSSFVVKLKKQKIKKGSRLLTPISGMQNLIGILSGFSTTGLFRRPAEAAAVPKHVVVEDLHTTFIPGSFPFPKAAGM